MLEALKTEKKVVGIKQLKRALEADRAETVFLAEDADPALTEPLRRLCEDKRVRCIAVQTMRELGTACGIAVGAAAAATVR